VRPRGRRLARCSPAASTTCRSSTTRTDPSASSGSARSPAGRIHPKEGIIMNEILIPTDGSPSADEAVEFGVELAAEQHARVTFMHVMAPIDWTQLDRGSVIQPIPSDLPLAHETILSEAVRFAASRDVAARVEVVAGLTAN